MNEAEKRVAGPTTGQFTAVLAGLVLIVGSVIVAKNGDAFLAWIRDLATYVNSGS